MTKTLVRRGLLDAAFAALAAVISLAALLSPTLGSAQSVPVIERIEPTSGPPGTSVTLVGRAMDAQTRIFLGALPCTITARTPNRWVFTIPLNAVTGAISVRTVGFTLDEMIALLGAAVMTIDALKYADAPLDSEAFIAILSAKEKLEFMLGVNVDEITGYSEEVN